MLTKDNWGGGGEGAAHGNNLKAQISVGKPSLGCSESPTNNKHQEDKGCQTLGLKQANSLLAEWPPGRGAGGAAACPCPFRGSPAPKVGSPLTRSCCTQDTRVPSVLSSQPSIQLTAVAPLPVQMRRKAKLT